MKTKFNPPRVVNFYTVNPNPVKLTALLYLQEALLEERYEECALFVAVANEFGAGAQEIQALLENPATRVGKRTVKRETL